VDEFGDHMLGCKSSLPTRTRLWHGPLVKVWLMLAQMAGLSCGKEVRNLMLHSGKRPDVVILGALRSIITDVRTVVGADPRYCAAAAVFLGERGLPVIGRRAFYIALMKCDRRTRCSRTGTGPALQTQALM